MNQLQELRKKNGDTQKTLAELLGVSEMTISRWEKEKELKIKYEYLQKLAEYFKVSIGHLLGITNDFEQESNDTGDIDPKRFSKGFDKLLLLTGYTSQEQLISSIKESFNTEKFTENFLSENSFIDEEDFKIKYQEAIEKQTQNVLGELSVLSIAISYLNDEASELLSIFFFLSDDDREKLLDIARVFSQNK
ncbi:helix-turn-helix domain-containing protein [Streptococcus bouchesdurhonensis]|uniref:helix-turn-helix domain-containing protein n=1 Tax=Streptococcus bouchesdurhonensis TaxID=2954240 RepID=UPI0021B7B83D|nr:helix-turn-helix transcriptional regulator [Streptococcus bouchesdurhonensis]